MQFDSYYMAEETEGSESRDQETCKYIYSVFEQDV
jgi:hypothetical protein